MRLSSLISPNILHKRGLTLLEIVVVVTIFSIIATMVFMVFRPALESWRRTESHSEIYQNARTALDMMARDLSAAILSTSDSSITFRGFNGSSPWRTNSIGDEVYFVAALNPTDPSAKFELCKVGYWLDGKGTATTSKDDELIRYYDIQTVSPPNYDFSANSTRSAKIALYVTYLNVRYYDSTAATWKDTWNSAGAESGRLPRMVEITITVREPVPLNPSDPKTQQFLTNVFIPAGQ